MQHHGGFSANLSITSTVHGPFTENPSNCPGYWGQRVPRSVRCGCTQTPLQDRSTRHTYAHSWYIMPHFLACLLLCVQLFSFSFTPVALLLWPRHAYFFIITQSGEAVRISEQNQRSSTSKFVSTAVAIHHRQQALHSTTHIDTYTKIQIVHRKQTKRSRSIYCNL